MLWKHITVFVNTYALSGAVYTLVGGATAIIEWGSFYILKDRLNVLPAACFAFLIATSVNYALSRSIVFRSMRTRWIEVSLLFALSTVAFLFNLGTFMLFYITFNEDVMVAKILGTGLGFAVNFASRQFLIFSPKSRFVTISSLLHSQKTQVRRGKGDQAGTLDR
jgi:putative flippase GtrA